MLIEAVLGNNDQVLLFYCVRSLVACVVVGLSLVWGEMNSQLYGKFMD